MFDWLVNAFTWLGELIMWFFNSFYEWAFNVVVSLISSALPASYGPGVAEFSTTFYSNVNFFFPLNELFALLTVLFTVWLSIFTARIILKLIPGIW